MLGYASIGPVPANLLGNASRRFLSHVVWPCRPRHPIVVSEPYSVCTERVGPPHRRPRASRETVGSNIRETGPSSDTGTEDSTHYGTQRGRPTQPSRPNFNQFLMKNQKTAQHGFVSRATWFSLESTCFLPNGTSISTSPHSQESFGHVPPQPFSISTLKTGICEQLPLLGTFDPTAASSRSQLASCSQTTTMPQCDAEDVHFLLRFLEMSDNPS